MAVCLFAGCGKKTPKDTTLEGTWRITKETTITKHGDVEERDEEVFPQKEDLKDVGLDITGEVQIYIKFKNNNILERYGSMKIGGTVSDKLTDEYPIINDLFNGLVLKVDETTYSATENSILINETGYDQEDEAEVEITTEYSYKIVGRKMVMTNEYVDESESFEEKTIIELEKVNDSVVADAKSPDDYEESEIPPFLTG